MRVILINGRYHGGGAERYVREVHAGLTERGHDATLYVGEPLLHPPDGVVSMPKPWERFLGLGEAAPDRTDGRLRGSIERISALRPGDVDVVHLNGVHGGAASIRALHALSRRIPCVWTLHDEWATSGGLVCDLRGRVSPSFIRGLTPPPKRWAPYDPYHENFRFRAMRRFLRQWMPRPAHVICPSQWLAQRARESTFLGDARVHAMPNPLRLLEEPAIDADQAQSRRALRLPEDRPVVLMVAGDLSAPHKGVSLGLDAVAGLPPSVGAFVFLLGRGGRGLVERLAPGSARCAYAGAPEALARAYRAADVVLTPSIADNFPYVVLEAFACARPVAGFAIGGVTEMIGDNERGRLAHELTPDALGDALTQLLADDGLRHRLGAAGRAWVRQHARLDDHLDRLTAVYQQAIDDGPSTSPAKD